MCPVHLALYPDSLPLPRGVWHTACGRMLDEERTALDPEAVTCGTCRRSQAFAFAERWAEDGNREPLDR